MALWALTSDTQFDEQSSYSMIGPEGISSRLLDSIRCFDWIVDAAITRKCKGLLHLGDVFDSRTAIDVTVLDQVGRAFWRAHDRGLEVILMAGNHDSSLRNATVNSLWPFAGVATIVDEPLVIEQFAFVPWVEDDDVFADGIAYVSANKAAHYLFAHCMIEGAVPAAIGVGRPLSSLNPNRWKQIVLGDVHDPVKLGKNVQYCGSPMQWHYGDAGQKRGFWLLDDKTGALEFIENKISPRFHLLTGVDNGKVRKGDFVRVRTEDPVVSREIVKSVSKSAAQRVDVEAVEIVDTEPRLAIRASDAHEPVLRRFVEYQGMQEVDGLVDLGLEILQEAQHG